VSAGTEGAAAHAYPCGMDSALLDLSTDGVRRHGLGQDAFHVLSYNQELVQFVDSKAGTLIVVNSLFIAASSGGGGPVMRGLEATCLTLGAVAILACLRVVLAGRRRGELPSKRPDVVFFQDIVRRQRAGSYVRDFGATSEEELAAQVLARAHAVAGIAAQKFDAYALARSATAFAAVVWILTRAVAVAVV